MKANLKWCCAKSLLKICVVVFIGLCSTSQAGVSSKETTVDVSFSELLMNSEQYVGSHVAVVGYSDVGFNFILYSSEANANFQDVVSALFLVGPPEASESCSGQYVRAVGKLVREKNGELRLYLVAIYGFDQTEGEVYLCWDDKV